MSLRVRVHAVWKKEGGGGGRKWAWRRKKEASMVFDAVKQICVWDA